MIITDTELAQCALEDSDLAFLELELRTGGSINVRQLLRAVIELRATRGAAAKVQELEEQVVDLEDQVDELKRDLNHALGEAEDVRRQIASGGL